MSKKSKIFLIAGLVLLVLVGVVIGLNKLIEHKLKTALQKNITTQELSYDELNVSLLGRSASISNFSFKTDDKKVSAKDLNVSGISIYEYLIHKKIEVSSIKLEEPTVVIYTGRKKKADTSKKDAERKIGFLAKTIEVSNASLRLTKSDSVKNTLFVRFPKIQLKKTEVNRNSLASGLPFKYESYQVKADSFFFNINEQHDLTVDEISLNDSFLDIKNIEMRPLYDKEEFQRHIPYEKDRFELQIAGLKLNSWNWGMENDSLMLQSPMVQIKQMDLELYRDKQVKDDPRHKAMYSKTIRDLPIKLKLDTVKLSNTEIKYEERVKADRKPGMVNFTELNASIYNLTNMGMNTPDFPTTNIEVETLFMGEANLKVNWNFDISNKMDVFRISGDLDNISGEGINQFLKPALNVKAQGGIRDMQFDYSGNRNKASGQMKLVYNDFKVEVLKEDGESKNNFLSALANLIISNDATSEERTQKDITATRTKTKSFWNYLWKMVRNGALKSFL